MACIKSTARGTGGGDVSGFVLPPQPVPAGHSILLTIRGQTASSTVSICRDMLLLVDQVFYIVKETGS